MVIFGGVWSGVSFLIIGFSLWKLDTSFALGLLVSGLGAMAIGNNTTIATLLDIEDGLLASASSVIHSATPWVSPRSSFDSVYCREPVGFDFKDVYIWVWILGAGAYLLGSLITYLYYPRRNEQELSNV
ncbi:MAG: hypothetical protein CM15mP49_33970 [Actinomycetota bacterium]|nr:MAG: hypothetical protein CM15mP49_33970 [Actinomycetota bacterium]